MQVHDCRLAYESLLQARLGDQRARQRKHAHDLDLDQFAEHRLQSAKQRTLKVVGADGDNGLHLSVTAEDVAHWIHVEVAKSVFPSVPTPTATESLQSSWGHAVHQCRVLATVTKADNNAQSKPGKGNGGMAGSLRNAQAKSTTTHNVQYRTEAIVTLRDSILVDKLLGPGRDALELVVPLVWAASLTKQSGGRVRIFRWEVYDHMLRFGDMDQSTRLSALSLGNLLATSALPPDMAQAPLLFGGSVDSQGINGRADHAGTDVYELEQAGGYGALAQDRKPQVLSHWWSCPEKYPVSEPTQSIPGISQVSETLLGNPSINPASRSMLGPPPAPPMSSATCGQTSRSSATSILYLNPKERYLSLTFNPSEQGTTADAVDGRQGAGRNRERPNPEVSEPGGAPRSGKRGLVKAIIPFELLAGHIAVRLISPLACSSLHPPESHQQGCSRMQLIFRLREPPEVYESLPRETVSKLVQKQLQNMIQQAKNKTLLTDPNEVPMSDATQSVLMSQWPLGSVRFNDHTWWKRAGEFTSVGAAGNALTYVCSIWQGPGADDAERLLATLHDCGLCTSPGNFRGPYGGPLPCVAVDPYARQKALARMRRLVTKFEQPCTCAPCTFRFHGIPDPSSNVYEEDDRVGYALLCLATNCRLPWELITDELVDLLSPSVGLQSASVTEHALYSFFSSGKVLSHEPLRVLRSNLAATAQQRGKMESQAATADVAGNTKHAQALREQLLSGTGFSRNSCVTRRVHVTPTRLLCQPPEVDLSNRVMRHWSEHRRRFVRVAFGDERGEELHLTSSFAGGAEPGGLPGARETSNKKEDKTAAELYTQPIIGEPWAREVLDRFRYYLTNGFSTLGRKHELLAFSSNQLRSASAWFVAPLATQGGEEVLSAQGVIFWLGCFGHIENRAKLAARHGQAFTCTCDALPVFDYTRPVSSPGALEVIQRVREHGARVMDLPSSSLVPASKPTNSRNGRNRRGARGAPSKDSLMLTSSRQERMPDEPGDCSDLLAPDLVILDAQGKVKYIISDGVGIMGMDVARNIMEGLNQDPNQPLAVQVRYAGGKGMLVPWAKVVADHQAEVPRDPTLALPQKDFDPKLLKVRPSMIKFESVHTAIEVVQIASFIPGYINRQIMLLCITLQRDPEYQEVFLDKAKAMAGMLDDLMQNEDAAVKRMGSLGYTDAFCTQTLKLALQTAWFKVTEPFVHSMLEHVHSHAMGDLKRKHRIFIADSAFLFGVLDEARVLLEYNVFVQVHRPGESEPTIIKDQWVLVTKNPCLHPGDIKVLRAVDKPELRHLVNVVVFSQDVRRPIPDTIAGSDLDGDQYFCCWDQQVVPLNGDRPCIVKPADYTALEPQLEKDLKVNPHLIDLYLDFQVHNTLGMIANAHVALADQHPLMGYAPGCLELAEKHAHAVDFAKTCRPVALEQRLKPKRYPHYMENANKESYHSATILGRIYDWALGRESDVSSALRWQSSDVGAAAPNPCLLLSHLPGWEEEVQAATQLCYAYNTDLLRLMHKFGCSSESELLSGWISCRRGSHIRKKNDLRPQVLLEVGTLRQHYQHLFLCGARVQVQSTHGLVSHEPSRTGEKDMQGLGDDKDLLGDMFDEAARGAVQRGIIAGGQIWDRAAGGGMLDTSEGRELEQRLLVKASAWYYVAYDPLRHPIAAASEELAQGAARAARGSSNSAHSGAATAHVAACGASRSSGFAGGGRGHGRGGPSSWKQAMHQAEEEERVAPLGMERGIRLLSFGWLHMQRLLIGLKAASSEVVESLQDPVQDQEQQQERQPGQVQQFADLIMQKLRQGQEIQQEGHIDQNAGKTNSQQPTNNGQQSTDNSQLSIGSSQQSTYNSQQSTYASHHSGSPPRLTPEQPHFGDGMQADTMESMGHSITGAASRLSPSSSSSAGRSPHTFSAHEVSHSPSLKSFASSTASSTGKSLHSKSPLLSRTVKLLPGSPVVKSPPSTPVVGVPPGSAIKNHGSTTSRKAPVVLIGPCWADDEPEPAS